MKSFACGDVVPGCRALFQGDSDQEILRLVGRHAAEDHGLRTVPAELVESVRAHIVPAA